MPKIEFEGHTIEVPRGANLRRALQKAGLSPYNKAARRFNCHGIGSCGTCALDVAGPVSPPTRIEKWRLGFPPHQRDSGLRLACQCRVEGDLYLEKHSGFWGQHLPYE
jgi:ferredoxin